MIIMFVCIYSDMSRTQGEPGCACSVLHTSPGKLHSFIIVTREPILRVSMGLTVNRQMAEKLTVNRQKRNIFTVNRQMSEPRLAVKFLRYHP